MEEGKDDAGSKTSKKVREASPKYMDAEPKNIVGAESEKAEEQTLRTEMALATQEAAKRILDRFGYEE